MCSKPEPGKTERRACAAQRRPSEWGRGVGGRGIRDVQSIDNNNKTRGQKRAPAVQEETDSGHEGTKQSERPRTASEGGEGSDRPRCSLACSLACSIHICVCRSSGPALDARHTWKGDAQVRLVVQCRHAHNKNSDTGGLVRPSGSGRTKAGNPKA